MGLRTMIPENFFREKRILITGGLGFIGSNLARRLVGLGARLTLVDSLIPEYGGNLFNIRGLENAVRVNISDVRDRHSMRYLVQGQDYLFNLAGQASHLDSMEDPETDLEINCRAQLSLLEMCRVHNPAVKLIFAGTRQIYGKPQYVPVDEAHPLQPADVNGIHKLAGEFYHLLYCQVYGIPASVLRLTNTIGPGMRIKDARQTFLGIWIRCCLEDTPFEVWEGDQLRDFTYVDDAVDALLLAAWSDAATGATFNLGGERPISLVDLAQLLVKVCGRGRFDVISFPKARKQIDIGHYYSDYGKIQATLGWTPQVALTEALQRTVAFYRENLGRYI
jgi:nucleoside-diphosphate-sugar epimerase